MIAGKPVIRFRKPKKKAKKTNEIATVGAPAARKPAAATTAGRLAAQKPAAPAANKTLLSFGEEDEA